MRMRVSGEPAVRSFRSTGPARVVRGLVALALLACSGDPAGTKPNTPPVVTIDSPAAGQTYAGGDELEIHISGADAEDGAIPADRLAWWSDLHHATHTHPFVPRTAGASGIATVPRVGHPETNVFYRIYASATDSRGAADTVWVDLPPQLTTLDVSSVPTGLTVTIDGQPRTTPFSTASVVGMDRPIGAITPQILGDSLWEYSGWSDAGDTVHVVRAPAETLGLTANFVATGDANFRPAVALTAPAGGSIVTEGTPVTLLASADDPDGVVARVEFLVGDDVIGEDPSEPFTFAWTPQLPLGARSLRARAFDGEGALTLSAAVQVTVQSMADGDAEAPVVALTSPDSGTRDLTGPVEITATATDNIGVTLVEFEVDGVPLASDATPPFSATLPSTASYTSGAHVLRARARDAKANWSAWSRAVVTFGELALPPGFGRSVVASGFGSLPTSIAFAPDGRIFITTQGGDVLVVKDGALLPTPFVGVDAVNEGERGLLGIALDPAFTSNHFVYVYYTTLDGGVHNRISRFTANGDVAFPGSEFVIADLPPLSDARRHNGGAMHFGPDGKLYVAVGDDGLGTNAQSLNTVFGKILRLNRDGAIPVDNPFPGTLGLNRAIWAMGLRNPYTFAFQPGTGRMHINDVGQETWEEVNLGRPGANYGWPATEGNTGNPMYDPPILAVRHSASPTLFESFAVVGGAFYDPPVNMFGADYAGDYFFADYVFGWIYRMDLDADDAVYAFAQLGESITGLGVGPDGALYVLVGTTLERVTREAP